MRGPTILSCCTTARRAGHNPDQPSRSRMHPPRTVELAELSRTRRRGIHPRTGSRGLSRTHGRDPLRSAATFRAGYSSSNVNSPTFPAPVVWIYQLSRIFTARFIWNTTFCIPAVAPTRARIKTPVSGLPVAICEVEFVLSSHVPAAAVTMDIRTFVTFPETGI